MQQNTIICIITNTVLFISMYFLAHIMSLHHQQLQPTSNSRFFSLFVVHIFTIFMMVRLIMIHDVYPIMVWAFQLSLVISLCFCAAEMYNFIKLGLVKPESFVDMDAGELTYLNLYFLILMYSLITAFVTGLFVGCTNVCMYFHMKKMKKALEECVWPVQYQKYMAEIDCPICLGEFNKGQQIVEIKCNHVFHRECLVQWVKLNQSCPTCRYHLFEQLDDRL